ncbi:Uncharacterised protein [Mycobacteroides abscessus subsp. abscessus]|uniref:hypothetical protein n=1 Tax=Mycobacteroides abscessus TaxID=36809 RepID=UPI0009272595|nr:hypothetical protein [Mycobacteroides abscessus]SIH37474.1 Uncharacterised protein [Mycobacteroides abscessus subsp. abscessus]
MWPFKKRGNNRGAVPRRISAWPETIPDVALAEGDRELIENRWAQALDRGFTVERRMQAAFDPPVTVPNPSPARPGSNAADELERAMCDPERHLVAFTRVLAEADADQQRRLPASVTVLEALGLTAQAARLGDYIKWLRTTGAWR